MFKILVICIKTKKHIFIYIYCINTHSTDHTKSLKTEIYHKIQCIAKQYRHIK